MTLDIGFALFQESHDLHIKLEVASEPQEPATSMPDAPTITENLVKTDLSQASSHNTHEDEFEFHEPPPFPDNTPGDEDFPTFPENDNKFTGFEAHNAGVSVKHVTAAVSDNISENDFDDFGDFGSSTQDADNCEKVTDDHVTKDSSGSAADWGFPDETRVTPPAADDTVVLNSELEPVDVNTTLEVQHFCHQPFLAVSVEYCNSHPTECKFTQNLI